MLRYALLCYVFADFSGKIFFRNNCGVEVNNDFLKRFVKNMKRKISGKITIMLVLKGIG